MRYHQFLDTLYDGECQSHWTVDIKALYLDLLWHRDCRGLLKEEWSSEWLNMSVNTAADNTTAPCMPRGHDR